jgi:GWxTD domain-containing protein|nr:MAG: hypothetical protein KatS3mg041_0998 [Bacteroidota bacterium]
MGTFVLGVFGLLGVVGGLPVQAQVLDSPRAPGSEERLEWIRQADRFIREVFHSQDRSRYQEATSRYLSLLTLLDDSLSASERALLGPHLEALRLILPPALAQRLEHPPVAADLLAWWRGQDARPATPRNERLEEHLERWAFALAHYSSAPEGLDDRGRVYIQYGPPTRKTQVRLDDARYRRLVLDREPTLGPLEFPENEFWVYTQIDKNLHYLFIRRAGEGFRIGSSEELIPRSLRSSPRRAEALLRTLEEIYRQLSLYHIDYGFLYDEVANYVATLESQLPQRPELPPTAYAQRMLAQVASEEAYLLERRSGVQTRSRTNTFDTLEPLEVALRWARFLDPDGTTRTELYWSGPARAFDLSRSLRRRLERERIPLDGAEYLLVATAVQADSAYQPRVRNYFRHRLTMGAARQSQALVEPRLYTLRGDTGLYHVAFELDQYLLPRLNSGIRLDSLPLIRAYVQRIDSVRALSSDPARVEMSDLMVFEALDPAAVLERPVPRQALRLYPHLAVSPGTNLVLYYEVYHLRTDPTGQARLRATYEVLRQVPSGPLGTEFRIERTSGSTTLQSSGHRTAEYLLLDTRSWTPGRVTVRLVIEDLLSGQSVERTVEFFVPEPT